MDKMKKEIKDFLKERGFPRTQENIEIVEDICHWWGLGSIEKNITGFYHKVRWEGNYYFFESYTGAFDHWSEKRRDKALELAQIVQDQETPGTKKAHSLIEKPGHCRKCNQKLNLDTEQHLMAKRMIESLGDLGMVCYGPQIREELQEAIKSGSYTCEKCMMAPYDTLVPETTPKVEKSPRLEEKPGHTEQKDLVYFQCVKDRNRLRIRITSPGYHKEANCQFPRAIRVCGRKYSAPASSVKLAKGRTGKFFYRVQKKFIKTLEDEKVSVKVKKVFEEENPECVVCMNLDHDVVIVPCGHYCLCKKCASAIKETTGKCPICRGAIELVATRDMIQT